MRWKYSETQSSPKHINSEKFKINYPHMSPVLIKRINQAMNEHDGIAAQYIE